MDQEEDEVNKGQFIIYFLVQVFLETVRVIITTTFKL